MNTARDNFYFVEDVMEMLGLSRSKSYKIMHGLNAELEKRGFVTVHGRVPKQFFHERLYCNPLDNAQQPATVGSGKYGRVVMLDACAGRRTQ
ncbi:MAG: hypothetical protein RR365_14290 [Bacteroides sp.]